MCRLQGLFFEASPKGSSPVGSIPGEMHLYQGQNSLLLITVLLIPDPEYASSKLEMHIQHHAIQQSR